VQPGDSVQVRQVHADGRVYRWWTATVESADDREIVLVWPADTVYEAPDPEGVKVALYRVRAFCWTDRPYNVVEHYDEAGAPGPIYSDIASPIRVEGATLSYTDYELDVARYPGQPVQIEDEDEFEEAIARYGYSPEHQAFCRRALEEARAVVEAWEPRGAPDFGSVGSRRADEGTPTSAGWQNPYQLVKGAQEPGLH
jgi:protein associated with RNAse G/E